MGPRWPGHHVLLSVWKAFTSTRNQMYASDTSRNPLQSWSSIFYWKPLFGQTFTHSITLLWHIWLKTVAKGAWETRRRREGGGVEKLPLFTKETREMNQWHWQANNRHIYSENRWKRLHILEKSSFLGLEPSTMIHTSCHFSPLLMFEFGSIRRCLAFPGQIHWWILNGIIYRFSQG